MTSLKLKPRFAGRKDCQFFRGPGTLNKNLGAFGDENGKFPPATALSRLLKKNLSKNPEGGTHFYVQSRESKCETKYSDASKDSL